jgi:hypothetical protein
MLFLEIGRRIGLARLAYNPEGLAKGGSVTEGAVFALFRLADRISLHLFRRGIKI